MRAVPIYHGRKVLAALFIFVGMETPELAPARKCR
jgi:hypothetical protein